MTRSVCLVFEVREPLLLRWYWPAEGYCSESPERLYFNFEEQSKAFREHLSNSYLPSNDILQTLADAGAKFSFRLDGSFLDLCRENETAMASFKRLVDSGRIELIGTPYYNTLSCFLGSYREFKRIVHMHKRALYDLFGYAPSTFANTCLIHNSRIGHIIKGMGFSSAIVGGEGLKPQYGYRTESGVMALPVHPQLSADIGLRFSDKKWTCHPLSAGTYASWVSHSSGELAVIYVDYSAFGAIHDKESGIFRFLESLPGELVKRGVSLITPSEYEGVESEYSGFYDTVSAPSFENVLGNHMQHLYFNEIKRMEQDIEHCPMYYQDVWRKLQTADILSDMAATRPWHPWDKSVSNMLLLSDFRRRTIEAMR